jgi:hypothetical protein
LFREPIMALTNKEKSRAFRARMYEAGYKQVQVWVIKEPEKKKGKITRDNFIRKLDELTPGWSKARLSDLFIELIKIIERKRKKEEKRK